MLKKLLSLMLTLAILASCIGVAVAAEAADGGISISFSQELNENALEELGYSYEISENETGTYTGTGMSVVKDGEDYVLELKPGITSDGVHDGGYIFDIPLGTTIDSSDDAEPFSIEATIKMPDRTTQSGGVSRLWGFPILSDGENDYKFGLYDFYHNASNEVTALYAQNENEYMKFCLNNGSSSNSAQDWSFMPVSKKTGRYLTYRFDIDPKSETFVMWFTSNNGRTWTKAYADDTKLALEDIAHECNVEYTGYEEAGRFPTGPLPETISSFKLRAQNRRTTEEAYYIKSIKVTKGKQSIIHDAVAAASNTMDFSNTTKYGTSYDLSGYAKSNGTVELATDQYVNTATGNKDWSSKQVLKWTPTASGSLAIPLEKEIDTNDGPFTYTIAAKIPTSSYYPRHLGALGANTATFEGEFTTVNHNLLGVTKYSGNPQLILNAANRKDGYWGYKTSKNTNIGSSSPVADKAADIYNIHIPENQSSWSNANLYLLNRPEEVGGASSAGSGWSYGAEYVYHYYKFYVDPDEGTYRFYHSDSRGYTEPYKNAYMMDGDYLDGTVSRYSDAGLFPLGTLPSVIKSINIRNVAGNVSESLNAAAGYGGAYYSIASIAVEHEGNPEFAASETILDATNNTVAVEFNKDIVLDSTFKSATLLVDGVKTSAPSVFTNNSVTFEATINRGSEYSVLLEGIESEDGDILYTTTSAVGTGYSWSFKNSDNSFKTDLIYSDYNCTAFAADAGDTANDGVYKWTFEANGQRNIDIPDLELGEYPIEIVMSAKLPTGYYSLQGFPMLRSDSDSHIFGLSSNSTNANRTSVKVNQALAHSGLNHYLGGSENGSNIGKIFPGFVGNLNAGSYSLSNDNTTSGGISTILNRGTDESKNAVGASAAMYDYKFVIDPLTKTYRYYQKLSSASDWDEIYDGLPLYPIAFADTKTVSSFTDTMPDTITKLRFRVADVSGENVFELGNITIKEVLPYEGIESRIAMREYTFDVEGITSEVNTVNSATTNITADVFNYTGEAIENAQVILAAYDSTGRLIDIDVQTKTIAIGKTPVAFDAVDTNANVTTPYETKTTVSSDRNTYKVYLWTDLTNLTPLTDNIPQI